MISTSVKNSMLKTILACALAGALLQLTVGQNCENCASGNFCCSPYGNCGTGDAFCGPGCQQGPCYNPIPPANNFSVPNLVTQQFFDSLTDPVSDSCEAKGFYTRDAFLEAVNFYPGFGRVGTDDVSKREIAAFFAHFTHETGHFCYINEQGGPTRNYCDPAMFPCPSPDGYYGRGPLQLSWNYNYASASDIIMVDILNNPSIVANDNGVSFKASLWFWMYRAVHAYIVTGQGFAATIRAINGMECNGGNTEAVNNRVNYYINYCNQFDVSPGGNLYC